MFSDSYDDVRIFVSKSLYKTLDVSVKKYFYRVPDDGAEEQSEEDEEWAPPDCPLPGVVWEVPQQHHPQQQPRHTPRDVGRVGHEVVLAGVPDTVTDSWKQNKNKIVSWRGLQLTTI